LSPEGCREPSARFLSDSPDFSKNKNILSKNFQNKIITLKGTQKLDTGANIAIVYIQGVALNMTLTLTQKHADTEA
jgi:hypothetical protein